MSREMSMRPPVIPANKIEDWQPSTSSLVRTWPNDRNGEIVLTLEVRDAVEGTMVNFRLGEVIIRQKLGEPLGMRIERTGVLF